MCCARHRLSVLAVLTAAVFAGPALVAQDDATDRAQALRKKLKNIVIPKLSFEDTPVSTVFAFLKERSRQLDPDGSGVNFVLILRPDKAAAATDEPKDQPKKEGEAPRPKGKDAAAAADGKTEKAAAPPPEPTITMDFDAIPVSDAIKYICEGAGLRYKVEPNAVVILPPPDRDNKAAPAPDAGTPAAPAK
jgi:hypothetical protein